MKIFIGSDDAETRREFSELCGQKKVKSFSVNTSIEASASSNTGASNRPLITTGMLERLNGNEKGDAIVSVRGYEPIWSVFTPSYELKKIYFNAGKTELADRKTKLFAKEDYVFDISGGKVKSEQEKILDEIEAEENAAEKAEREKKEYIEKLDEEWKNLEKTVRERLEKLMLILDSEDAAAIQKAALENKVALLYMIADKYDKSTEQKLRAIAQDIEELLAKMQQLQNLAIEKTRIITNKKEKEV